jgi:hypothetical protein
VKIIVVDRHRFYADPDPDRNFHFDADPDPDPDWHQMMPILMRILSQVSLMLENPNFFSLLVTTLPVYNVLPFSSMQGVIVLSILDGRYIKILWKKKCSFSTFLCTGDQHYVP